MEHPWSGLRGVWVPEGVEVRLGEDPPQRLPCLKWRWIVERTFAWLSTWRRLAKDYEVLPSSEEAWIYLAMSRIMLRLGSKYLLRPLHTASFRGAKTLHEEKHDGYLLLPLV